MRPSHFPSCWRALRGLVLALLSTWAAAGPAGTMPDPAVMESLGMYAASLQAGLEESDVRGLSQPTEHQVGVLELHLRHAQLARRHMETRGRQLPPDSRQAKVLQHFLEEWSEERFAEGFRTARRHSLLDPAVRQLVRTFPEARHSKPWFPLFRP